MRMALNMPVSAFAGIALRLTTGEDGLAPTATVTLEHRDPSLVLSLFVSAEIDDAFTEWRSWANVLGLPLLVYTVDDPTVAAALFRRGIAGIFTNKPGSMRRALARQ